MHSYYRSTINTVEEWLDHIKEQEHEPDSTIDSIYPVQSTALLYEEYLTCQEEKQMGHKTKQDAYEQGAKDVYYGRPSDVKDCLTAEQMDAYWNGYAAEPYGRKDNGYDEE